jgi:dienelactone hydrolase
VIAGAAEAPLELERPDGTRLAAVVTRPGEEPLALCAVLLNAGAERRIGPNRMWVELARRWAARGVTVVRLDVTGIGEASGPAAPWGRDPWTLYETDLVEQVRAALHDLRALGLPERTVLVGLCSGAYWGFQAACSDAHVAAALLFNSRLLVGDRFHGRSYDVPEAWKVASPAHWLRVLRDPEGRAHGLVMLRAVLRLLARAAAQAPVALRARLRARRTGSSSLERALDALRDRGVTLRLLFSPEEPVHRRLEREGTLAQLERWPNLRVEALPGPEAHTLQLVRLERAVHRRLDELLDELLGSAA